MKKKMKTYITLFDKHTEYEDFIDGEVALPNVSYCVQENEVHYKSIPHDYSKDYLTFIASENGTFQWSQPIGAVNTVEVSYDNGLSWQGLAAGTPTPTISAGKKVLWKATHEGIGTTSGLLHFSSSGQFNVCGNVLSVVYGDDFAGTLGLENGYELDFLFEGSGVVDASALVMPTFLNVYSCANMFRNCTSLTTAPELPATTVASSCYESMFYGCTSLTTAPQLPATTLADRCYFHMFNGCTSLTTAPQLPATTLADVCYSDMFNGCTSLTTAPQLPATTLASFCYRGMFHGCGSLTTAPQLPATTLASNCYQEMFNGCTSLTTAPQLPATTLAEMCYDSMFQDCISLRSITCLATDISASNCTYNWVSGVSPRGTFTKASSMTSWTSGESGIPSNWTVVDA